MAAHTLMVLSIILGRAVGWGNQNRETDGTSWGDAIRIHAFPTVLGIAWTVLAVKISPTFAAWMSPILLGLVLDLPLLELECEIFCSTQTCSMSPGSTATAPGNGIGPCLTVSSRLDTRISDEFSNIANAR